MKKILFIHHAKGWGGAPLNMINIIKNLDQNQYEVEVLLLKHSVVADKLNENNIKFSLASSKYYKNFYQYISHSEAGYIRWYQIFRFLKLWSFWLLSRYYFAEKELKKHSYDIVHLNSSVLTDWIGPAKQYGKVVIHIQEPFHRGRWDIFYHCFTTQMRKYADKIIAISEDNARRVGIPEKTEVIYNYAEVPQVPTPEYSYTSKKVLYLGGAAYIKGFYTLVEALDYLETGVLVYFGGNYTEKAGTRNLLKQIIQRVLRYGRKRKMAIDKMRNHINAIEKGMVFDVPRYLDEVCCLVSPFAVSHFSRPVLEAHLHQKPSIVSNVQGMEEIIQHDKNGLIVPKNDAKALADAINWLTFDGDRAKRLGEEGYRTAVRQFSPENIHKFQLLYDKL